MYRDNNDIIMIICMLIIIVFFIVGVFDFFGRIDSIIWRM